MSEKMKKADRDSLEYLESKGIRGKWRQRHSLEMVCREAIEGMDSDGERIRTWGIRTDGSKAFNVLSKLGYTDGYGIGFNGPMQWTWSRTTELLALRPALAALLAEQVA